MRALFYVGEQDWSGSARAFVAAARGLSARNHQITFVCCSGGSTESHARAAGIEVVPIERAAGAARTSWTLRRILRERFIEVVFVQSERGQLIASSAMRLAERGAVIRRVPSFQPLTLLRSGRVALKMAAAGLLFSTERELRDNTAPEFPLPATVAPLGVSASDYDTLTATARTSLDIPGRGVLLVCRYEPSARLRAANTFRTLAALAARHREIHVIMVGRGSDDADLRMHASALGVGRFVSFLGERADELSVLRAADVGWVVAEHDEGAFACLDFMAMRIPVLADRGPTTQHYIADGSAGVLLSPGDPSITAATVAAFLAHADRRVAMGNAGYARVQREFPESAMIDGFERAAVEATDRARWALR